VDGERRDGVNGRLVISSGDNAQHFDAYRPQRC